MVGSTLCSTEGQKCLLGDSTERFECSAYSLAHATSSNLATV